MRKKAFTLIELLAVIILLGIIAMLVYPSVNDVVNDSKKRSFKLSVTGIYKTVETDTANSDFTINSKYIYKNGVLTKVKENGQMLDNPIVVKTEGKLPDGDGTVVIDNEGNIIVKIDNQKWCGYNDKTKKTIEVMDGICDELIGSDNMTPEYCFNFDKVTGTITGYNYDGIECTTDVVIPDTIDDVIVQHIGYVAFVDEVTFQACAEHDEDVGYEVDPNYVHYDGDDYQYCYIEGNVDNPITSVVLPQDIISIKDWAFGYNQISNLSLDDLPNLTKIGAFAFMGNQLTELVLSDLTMLTIIDEGAFYRNQLTSLTLNNLPNLTTIEYGVFIENQLSELTLADLPKLTTIGEYAFVENQISELTLSNLPKLTTIGEAAFAENQISELTLSNLPKLTTIDDAAFLKNSSPGSNPNLSTIINETGQLFNWSKITGSNTSNQTFETGTIIHQNGNISVVDNRPN